MDVSVRADCFKVVSQIAEDLGGLHHLVNCVAYFGSESLGATEDDWDKTMKVKHLLLDHYMMDLPRLMWLAPASWFRQQWSRCKATL